MTDPTTDAALVAAVLGGDQTAFTRLVERYRDQHIRFALRMLSGNRQDAEEALQSAWLRAYRALDQCADPARFGAWLYHIVVNECRSKGTQRGRRDRWFVDDEEAIARSATPPDVDRTVLRDEIELALSRLEPTYREAFVLKYVEELSYEEMAEITGAGVSALKMRVKRACEKLRAHLEGVTP